MSKTMTQMSKNLKYQIQEHLEELPYGHYKIVKKKLPSILGINKRTFHRWLIAKENESLEIPSDKLAIIAKFLNKPIEKMFNYKIPEYNLEHLHTVSEENVLDEFNFSK